MADFNSLTCDRPGCGVFKKQANHWYRLRVDKAGDTAGEFHGPRIVISTVDDMPDRTADACSLGCLMTMVQSAVSDLYGAVVPPEPFERIDN